ncbi:MAG TPA: NUDIX domain-containing protein [Allosphingosinicella sp.]|nr:NUDIX domain-containing protein [Allosphingosinicella sp.]
MTDLPDPIPAATLILMRGGAGAPELLMIERSQTMAFAAGALVFPGGRIDPDDEALADRAGPGIEHAAARIAAIRETLEETGVAPAVTPAPAPAIVSQIRQELEEGTPFSALLDGFGLSLDLGALTPFARWCPTFRETRRFDTLFFLAEASGAGQDATVAEAEAVRLFWAPAAAILGEADAGRARIIFPTRRNLERLARFASVEEARADARRYPVRTIVPWIERRGGQDWLCIPDEAGYPVTAERLETARRA